jgi:hypothetical protein
MRADYRVLERPAREPVVRPLLPPPPICGITPTSFGYGRLHATPRNVHFLQLDSVARNGIYRYVIVESFHPSSTAARHGPVHIRPLPSQGLDTSVFVECSKRLSEDYPVGTIFKVRAKLTDRERGGEYLYSYHGWSTATVTPSEAERFIRENGPWVW